MGISLRCKGCGVRCVVSFFWLGSLKSLLPSGFGWVRKKEVLVSFLKERMRWLVRLINDAVEYMIVEMLIVNRFIILANRRSL